jgi:hypothetical protein
MSVGITQYIAYRDGRGIFDATAEAVGQDQEGGAFISQDRSNFWHVRALWKLGVFADYDPLTFGFTCTTPSVGLFGNGNVYYNRSVINLDTDDDGTPTSSMASNYQNDVATTYKSPLSIAGGFSYGFGKRNNSRVHVTVEWFNCVKEYALLDPEPFTAQTSGEVISNQYTIALRSVVNFGFGFEQRFSDLFTLYGSLYRDASAREPTAESRFLLSTWDIYHIAGGAAFTVLTAQLTLGLEYAFGNAPLILENSLENPTEGNNLTGGAAEASAKFKRLLVLLGFSFGF